MSGQGSDRPGLLRACILAGTAVVLLSGTCPALANRVSFSAPRGFGSGPATSVVAGEAGEYLLLLDSDPFTLQRSLDGGATWSPLATLSDAFQNAPRLVHMGSGVWLLVAHSTDDLGGTVDFDTDILYSRSVDGGATWSPVAALNSDAATDNTTPNYADEDQQPAVLRTGATSWLALWSSWQRRTTSGPDQNWRLTCATSADDAATWSPVATCIPLTDDLKALGLDAAADGSGTVLASWSNDAFGQTFTSASSDGGATWSSPFLHDPVGFHDTRGRPRIATDGAGTWLVARTTRGFTPGIEGGTLLVRRSTDDGSTWSAPFSLPGDLSPKDLVGFAPVSTLAYSAAEATWIVAWRGTGFGFPLSEYDIFYSVSRDGSFTWTRAAVANGNGSKDKDDEFGPWLAAGPAGGWALSWGRLTEGRVAFAAADCPSVPAVGCRTTTKPGKSRLDLSNSSGPRDQIKWTWVGEATDFADWGSPDVADAYVMCVYDDVGGTPRLVLEKDIPTPSQCAGDACWEVRPDGYRFQDRKRAYTSTSRVDLKAGDEGRAKIKLLSKGSAVAPPPLPLAGPATAVAQLHNTTSGLCWEAAFSVPKKNTDKRYKAGSD